MSDSDDRADVTSVTADTIMDGWRKRRIGARTRAACSVRVQGSMAVTTLRPTESDGNGIGASWSAWLRCRDELEGMIEGGAVDRVSIVIACTLAALYCGC